MLNIRFKTPVVMQLTGSQHVFWKSKRVIMYIIICQRHGVFVLDKEGKIWSDSGKEVQI